MVDGLRNTGVRLSGVRADPTGGSSGRHRLRARMVVRRIRWQWNRTRARLPVATPRPLVAIGLVEHMGGIVATQPVTRHLHRETPSAFLVWVVGARYQELPTHHPDLDAVAPVHCLSEWIALREAGVFDRIIDLHFDGSSYVPCGGGFGTGVNGVLLHAHGSADTSEVSTVLDALATPLARYADAARVI